MYSGSESQTAEFVRQNIVKIIDKSGELYGTGFFIEVNNQVYCVTCHHCIYTIDEILIQKDNQNYNGEWQENLSDANKDLAVLKVKNYPVNPLLYHLEVMPGLSIVTYGFSAANINRFPNGMPTQNSVLSSDSCIIVFEAEDIRGKNTWNKKPKVSVNIFECAGNFEFGFSGAPVCYSGNYKVIGILTAISTKKGYVIPIQTLLEKFRPDTQAYQQATYREINTLDASFANFDEVLKIVRTGNQYFRKNEYDEAIKKYDEVLSNQYYIVSSFNKACALSELGRHEEAIGYYDKVLDIDSKDVGALVNKSAELGMLGKYADGIKYCDKALRLSSENLVALTNMCVLLANSGRYEEAIVYYDKVLTIDPKDTAILNDKGIALRHLRRYEEAIVYYDKVLNIDPNHIGALGNKGVALGELENYGEAIAYQDRVLAIDPNNLNALSNRSTELSKLKRFEEALTYCDRVLAIDPDHIGALVNKGAILIDTKRHEEALDNFNKVLVLDSANVYALANKGSALFYLGRIEEAIRYCDKALGLEPNHPVASYIKKLAVPK